MLACSRKRRGECSSKYNFACESSASIRSGSDKDKQARLIVLPQAGEVRKIEGDRKLGTCWLEMRSVYVRTPTRGLLLIFFILVRTVVLEGRLPITFLRRGFQFEIRAVVLQLESFLSAVRATATGWGLGGLTELCRGLKDSPLLASIPHTNGMK